MLFYESSKSWSNRARDCQLRSSQQKDKLTGVESGFRNILVHDYLGGIDLNLIWQVIEQELPILKNSLLSIQE